MPLSLFLPRHIRHRMVGAAILLLATLGSATQLVRDINTMPLGVSGTTQGWWQVGGYVLFVISDEAHGSELWRSDGTVNGTQLVRDINPGPADAGISSVRVMDGTLYFFGTEPTNGYELWRSDGTSTGTHIVANIDGGPGDSIAGSVTAALNGVLYFAAADATHGQQLWRSDGSSNGTYALTTLTSQGSVGEFTAVADTRVFFTAEDDKGQELWATSGTVAGTRRVADINPGAAGSEPSGLTATSVGVFFVADDGSHGTELWFARADGSQASMVEDLSPGLRNTQAVTLIPFGADLIVGCQVDLVPPLNPQPTDPGPGRLLRVSASAVTTLASPTPTAGINPIAGFASYAGRVLLSMNTNGPDPVLWVTDGTATGTKQLGAATGLAVVTFPDGAGGGVVGGDGVYFGGRLGPPAGVVDLWRTDGTEAGTVRYATMPSTFFSSDMAQFQGKIWFQAGQATPSGREPWVTDGTVGGTVPFADLATGDESSSPSHFAVVNGKLWFFGSLPGSIGETPWVTDGTVGGTMNLVPAAASRTAGADVQVGMSVGNRLVFFANDGRNAAQMWSSNGTRAGTVPLVEGCGFGRMIIALGTKALMSCTDLAHGAELWVTDGLPAGTGLLLDINPGPGSSNPAASPDEVAVLNGIAYFMASDGTHGPELWRSDGTAAGTFLVADITPGSGGGIPHDLHVVNGRLLFQYSEGSDRFWWSTDGTQGGTQRVTAAMAVLSDDSTVLNGLLYFGAHAVPVGSTPHAQLWRTDGTAGGTQLVVDPSATAGFAGSASFITVGSRMVFQYCGPGVACGMYGSDGTAVGTMLISSEGVGGGTIVGGRLFYTVGSGTNIVLKVTDGTMAGTRDVLTAPNSEGLGAFAVVQGYLVFFRIHPQLGPSLWRTDGTVAGTRLAADFDPSNSSDEVPYVIGNAGSTTLVSAWAPQFGRELFALNSSGPNAGDDTIAAATAVAKVIPVLANDGAVVDAISPGTIQVTQPPAFGSVSVDTANGSVSYTSNAGFSGGDQFQYTVADVLGHQSNAATVFVAVAPAAGPAPGTAPPGGNDPGSSGGGGGGGGGKGGGGASGVLELAALALLWLLNRRRWRVHPTPSRRS